VEIERACRRSESSDATEEVDGVDCENGIDAATGAECDGEPAANAANDPAVVLGAREAGRDEECAELVAVEADSVGLVVEPGAADMDCWGVLDGAFLALRV